MSVLLQQKYTILGRAPYLLGEFTLASYKAREGVASGLSTTSGRVVLMRRFAVSPSAGGALVEASRICSSLPADAHILRHFGLVTVDSDPGDEAGPESGLYAVSEWVQGMTLGERIRRVAPFSLTAALNTAIDVCHAVLRASAAGVEHGNLTADEVFVTSDGVIKVADFALGQAVVQASLAPDQVQAPFSSLRSIGVLLYEMLTGQSASGMDGLLAPKLRERSVPTAVDGITQKASLGESAGGYTGIAPLLADLETVREQIRLGRPLDWTPLDQQGTKAAMFPVAASPPPARRAGATEKLSERHSEKAFVPVNSSETMPNTPHSTPPESTRQQIPPVRIETPANTDGGEGDYDDYEPPRSRSAAVFRGIGIIIGSIFIIGIVFACVYFAMLVSNVPSDISVPPLIGKQYSDAKSLAGQSHFNLVEAGHSNSDTWPQGAIYQQTPASGRMIKSGKDVDVFVSDGPRLLDVPDLSQTALSKAQAVLQDAGLPLGSVQQQYDPIVPKGIVISQQPIAAAKVARDQAINLTVSNGPPPPTAPTNVSATCTIAGEIDLAWDQVPVATAYDIYRDGTKIQSGFPETEYSDVGLDTDKTHLYTVTAVDSNGESPASQAVSAIAEPATVAPPPADGTDAGSDGVAPDPDAPAQPLTGAIQAAPKQRQFEVKFRVPHGSSYTHNVQIQVQDATGTNVAYDQDLSRGDVVDQQVQGFGNRIILRIFIDNKLVKQQRK